MDLDKPTIIKLLKNISKEQAIKDYNKLETFNIDELTNETRKGNKFIDYFTFEERLNTIGIKGMNYWDFVSNTEYHNRPYIKKMLDYQDGINYYVALYRIFKLHCGSIGLFSPVRAIDVLSQFGISSILDFCVGWGSCPVAASVLNIPSFIGIDTNKNLEQPYNNMIDLLVNELGSTTDFRMIFDDAVTVDYSILDYDCVFTSPPYYNKELYSYCNKRTEKEWDEEFYIPVIRNTFKYLKVGGYYILNIPTKIYMNICIELLGEADIIMDMKKKCHPKNRYTNKDYKEHIYVWLKKP